MAKYKAVVGWGRDGAECTDNRYSRGHRTPAKLGITTTRVEVFCDNPDELVAQAVAAGARGRHDRVREHEAPWGIHRQGGFNDPFGHIWLVGDRSPLGQFS